jgi:hypothetical protein
VADVTDVTEEWITRAEAADRAGVHRNTVIDFERRGLVTTRRENGPSGERVMVSAADLEQVIAARPNGKAKTVAGLEAELAALQAELDTTRRQLEEVKAERADLLSELVAIARGRRS